MQITRKDEPPPIASAVFYDVCHRRDVIVECKYNTIIFHHPAVPITHFQMSLDDAASLIDVLKDLIKQGDRS